MEILKTITIGASCTAIWDLITKSESIAKWSAYYKDDRPVSSGEPRVGFRSKSVVQAGRRTVEFESEITAYQPASHLGFTLSGKWLGKMPLNVNYWLDGNGSTTILRYKSSWHATGFFKLIALPFSFMLNRLVTKELTALKALAEDH